MREKNTDMILLNDNISKLSVINLTKGEAMAGQDTLNQSACVDTRGRYGTVSRGVSRSPLGWVTDDERRRFDPLDVFNAGIRHHHLANTAYPIAHRKTIWDYRQPQDRHTTLLKTAFRVNRSLSLYMHIPFCEHRCRYCEYTVLEEESLDEISRYQRALLRELTLYRDILDVEGSLLAGFDIGGGTPLLMEAELIIELVEQVCSIFRVGPGFSISIETTPKVAASEPDRLRLVRASGVERISMGLQMVNPRLLRQYGRDLNRVGSNRLAVDNIRSAGFERFNIDLMYGFTHQGLDDFRRSLEYTIQLGPEYITLYRMRYKGTRIQEEACDIELDRIMAMYSMAYEILTGAGYLSQPGKNTFSRLPGDVGTSAYLTERVIESTPYLGLGLGAQTFTNNILAYNLGAAEKRLVRYMRAISSGQLPIQDLYHLPRAEAIAKMISVSFYFGQVTLAAFSQKFGIRLEDWFPDEIAFVLENGLMEYAGLVIRLTEKGARHFNGVIALFYSDRVKEHLLQLEEG